MSDHPVKKKMVPRSEGLRSSLRGSLFLAQRVFVPRSEGLRSSLRECTHWQTEVHDQTTRMYRLTLVFAVRKMNSDPFSA